MPKLSRILAVFALFLFAVIARSQGTVVGSVQVGNGAAANSDNARSSIGTVGGGVISGFGGGGLGAIKGQPFSADVIDETDRFLADGNHIHHEMHGKIFRDSEGRSRTESEVGGFMPGVTPLLHIQIHDPVENALITLDQTNKVAMVHHFGERAGFKAPPSTGRPAQSGSIALTAPPRPPEGQSAATALPGAEGPRSKRQISREDLGTMEIEGHIVKGTRTTITTPAGAMGNDKPMTTTNERWFSAELNMELVIKTISPESGEHTRKLVNIRSGDPDPLMFQVPPDYTVKELKQ